MKQDADPSFSDELVVRTELIIQQPSTTSMLCGLW